TFDAHERGKFVLFMRALDIGGGERHHHAGGMLGRLLVYGIDEVKRVLGVAALISLRLNPDREKIRAQGSAVCFVEADVCNVMRMGGADVEAFVQKTLRRVGVSVDDNRGIVDFLRGGADGSAASGRSLSDDERRSK